MANMIIKPRPAQNCFAVKVKGIVSFKGTEAECIAWVKAEGGTPVHQAAGKPASVGATPKAPRAPKVPTPKTPKAPRAKKGDPLPVVDGKTQCPTKTAKGGSTKQRRKAEPKGLNLPLGKLSTTAESDAVAA